MAIQLATISELSFAGGIDARSAENLIKSGFVQDLLNADIIENRVLKRAGYQGYAGNLPLRVKGLKVTNELTDNVTLLFDRDVDFVGVGSTPLVIYGKVPSSALLGPGGISDTDKGFYVTGFRDISRKNLLTGTNTFTIPPDETGLTSTNAFVGITQTVSTVSTSNNVIWPDFYAVEPDGQVIMPYTNESLPGQVIIYYLEREPVIGSVYVSTTWTVAATGLPVVHTISQATHGLSNLNLITEVYTPVFGAGYQNVKPDSIVIKANGNIEITITNNTAATLTFKAILSVAEPGDSQTIQVNSNHSGVFTVPSTTKSFIFPAVYELSGTDKIRVYPESVVYNSDAESFTITFANNMPSVGNFTMHWLFGQTQANKIIVTIPGQNTSSSVTVVNNPQMTVWGLDHANLYETTENTKAGWVNHLDTYRSQTGNRVVSGLGGNLFTAQEREELSEDYLLGSFLPTLSSIVAGDRYIAPPFVDTGVTSDRSRGYITGDNLATGFAQVSEVAYDGANGTKYTLSIPNLAVDGVLSTIISSNPTTPDYLTVQGMSYTRHNGEFKIKDVQLGTNELYIWVENSAIVSDDYDDSNLHGLAIVATDQIVVSDTPKFLPGDTFNTDAFEGLPLTVVTTDTVNNIIVVSGVTNFLEVGNGLTLPGIRSSKVVPMSSLDGIVMGDMLSYTGITRLLKVKHVYGALSDVVATSTVVSAGVATMDIGATELPKLNEGMAILLIGDKELAGVQTVDSIVSETAFTFLTDAPDGSYIMTLVGKTVTIDEDLSWAASVEESNLFKVETRWIPVESPEDSFNQTPDTYVSHLTSGDYTNQNFLRSAMVSNNMYFTNYDDPVMKYDGSSLYRAGLPTWQPGLFVSLDTGSAGGKIVNNNPKIDFKAPVSADLQAGKLELLNISEKGTIPIGTIVRLVYGTPAVSVTKLYTVQGYESLAETTTGGVTTPAKCYIQFTESLVGTGIGVAGIARRVDVYKYYFRLNAVDANDNLIASATTQFDDFTVAIVDDAAVRLRLVGLPVLDNYDYDRIEFQIYRTTANTSNYKLVTTLALDFNINSNYIDFIDTFSDENLSAADEIRVATKGARLANTLSEPLRAKYLTTAGNRLVLANVKDYPQFDVQFLASTSVDQAAFIGKTFGIKRDINTSQQLFQFVGEESKVSLTSTSVKTESGVITIDTATNHGLVASNWVYLTMDTAAVNIPGRRLDFSGWWRVDTAPSTTQFTIKYEKAPPINSDYTLTSGVDNSIRTTTFSATNLNVGETVIFDSVPSGSGFTINTPYYVISAPNSYEIILSATPTGNPIVPTSTGAAKLTITPNGTTTSATPTVLSLYRATFSDRVPVVISPDSNLGQEGGNTATSPNTLLFTTIRRLGNAINAYIKSLNDPWLVARAGGDLTPAGLLRLRVVRPDVTAPEIELPQAGNSFQTFVNSRFYDTSSALTIPRTVTTSSKLFPSRILISYPNYPELFDNPTAEQDTESDSAIDINSADGQEITGVIPFFGESAFGASQQSGVLLVFKTNSVYLVNLAQKAAGGNAVERLETQGLGCTFPYSISVTKDGIIFANDSGIYSIRRDNSISYIGRFMERNWVGRVNRLNPDLIHGHHYAIGRQYKVSVALGSEQTPSEVYVYNHTNEARDGNIGAWSRYDNHNAIGWANFRQDAFWASTDGKVYSIRRAENTTDYRDGDAPIAFRMITRALDFGAAGIRKLISKVIVHYRVGITNLGTVLSSAVDTNQDYIDSETFEVGNPISSSGIDDRPNKLINTIAHSIFRRKGVYFQVKLTNESIDENLEIAGMDFRVGGLSDTGIVQAGQTKPT
jgi:hypothetical protein